MRPDMTTDHRCAKVPGKLERLVQRNCTFGPVGNWYENHSHIGDSFSGGGLRGAHGY
jgi:hypothetical protein